MAKRKKERIKTFFPSLSPLIIINIWSFFFLKKIKEKEINGSRGEEKLLSLSRHLLDPDSGWKPKWEEVALPPIQFLFIKWLNSISFPPFFKNLFWNISNHSIWKMERERNESIWQQCCCNRRWLVTWITQFAGVAQSVGWTPSPPPTSFSQRVVAVEFECAGR